MNEQIHFRSQYWDEAIAAANFLSRSHNRRYRVLKHDGRWNVVSAIK